MHVLFHFFFFFFNDTATTEIYTLSLHDALPISSYLLQLSRRLIAWRNAASIATGGDGGPAPDAWSDVDRKSTRLNSSHGYISYAVFCLKKKKNQTMVITARTTFTVICTTSKHCA